jgi:hypothetical protein
MKKIWAKKKNVVVKRTRKSKNLPLEVSEDIARTHLSGITFHSIERNDVLLIFCDSHAESSALDSSDSEEDMLSDAPGDEESIPMEEDREEEQQEVFESTLENPALNPKAFLPMSEDVDMMEAQAPVTKEPISNITEHEENNNVSLFYCYILKFILTDLNIKEP